MNPNVILLIVLAISILLSWIFPSFAIPEALANTLFTIAGIMFSIGLSLTIVSSTSGVKNQKYKKIIRKEIAGVRNKFIWIFIFDSLTYIAFTLASSMNCTSIRLSFAVLLVQMISIIYFIVNFMAIEKLNQDIEDKTD